MAIKKTTTKKPVKKLKEKPAPKSSHAEIEKLIPKEDLVDLPVEGGDIETSSKIDGDEKNNKKERYYQAIGRRKESVATVRLYTKKSTDLLDGDYALVTVNGKDYRDYFSNVNLHSVVESSLRKLKSLNRFKATVKVSGGGLSGQADAIKHGLARALVLFDLNFRKKLKKSGFLTRDSRIKERRKYGLKKARKAPGWSKR